MGLSITAPPGRRAWRSVLVHSSMLHCAAVDAPRAGTAPRYVLPAPPPICTHRQFIRPEPPATPRFQNPARESLMKIHEYQGKEILRQFGVPVPRGYPAFSVLEASEAAQKLGGPVWVVKAQIHAGGRGKGGGVKLARSVDDVKKLAGEILGMQLKTHQTGPEGQKVRRLLIEEGADIKKEYYVAAVTDRATQKVAMMASSEGGMDIEEVAHATPEKILKVFIDPLTGMTDAQATELAAGIGIPAASQAQAVDVLKKLYACYMATDASLAEINPLILDGNGNVKALDAKFNFDSN